MLVWLRNICSLCKAWNRAKKIKSKQNQNVFGETIGIRMSIKESHCVFVIFQIYNRNYEQDYVRLGDTPHAYLLSALLIKRTLH